MTYSLRARPRSSDYDLIDDVGDVLGQVIKSPAGYTLYLIGDLEPLLGPMADSDGVLEAFELNSRSPG